MTEQEQEQGRDIDGITPPSSPLPSNSSPPPSLSPQIRPSTNIGSLLDWNIEQRFTLFKWLLLYTKNAHVAISGPTPTEVKENEHLVKVVRKNCCMALKHLGGVGKIVPDEAAAHMLKEDLFAAIIDIDDDGYIISLSCCPCCSGLCSSLFRLLLAHRSSPLTCSLRPVLLLVIDTFCSAYYYVIISNIYSQSI